MKFYRLTENDPRYGMTGNVIPISAWKALPFTDRPLYQAISESGRGYPYKVEVAAAGHTPALYYIDDYADIVSILERLAGSAGVLKQRIPLYVPKSSATLQLAVFEIKIRYRSEWEQQDTTNLSKRDT